MSLIPKHWVKWLAVVLGVAAFVTPALFDLGWIPQSQSHNVLIFLLGFMLLDGAARELTETKPVPELVTSTEGYFYSLGEWTRNARHEIIAVVQGEDVVRGETQPFLAKLVSRLETEKQLHLYTIVAARIAELSKESFERRMSIERDPSLEGRFHYRFLDAPVSFGCQVYDQTHWAIDFPPNPSDPRGAAIMFKNDPDGARLVASFIRHQWLDRPGVTMSLSEAYEKWKALQVAGQPLTSV